MQEEKIMKDMEEQEHDKQRTRGKDPKVEDGGV